jgi:hypothetical protein
MVIRGTNLYVEVLKDLDYSWFQARNLQTVLNPPDEADWIDFGSYVLQ